MKASDIAEVRLLWSSLDPAQRWDLRGTMIYAACVPWWRRVLRMRPR